MFTALTLGVGLAMDAVAVSIAAGIAGAPLRRRDAPAMALTFGVFQAVMPILGWLGGVALAQWITAVDHWVACGLLGLIGGKMVYESFDGEEARAERGSPFAWTALFVAGLATSIDALAVGVTLAALQVSILGTAAIIGVTTVLLCWPAVLFGGRLGTVVAKRAELVGGLLLIGLGVKILVEHTVLA